MMEIEKPKIEWIDYAVIIFYGLVFIIFLDYRIAFPMTIIFIFIITMIDRFIKNVKLQKKVKLWANWLLVSMGILAIIDTATTYYAVHIKKFATEINPIVIGLWDNYGLISGEAIRLSLIILMTFIIYKNVNSNHNGKLLAGFFLLLFLNTLWAFVSISNIIQIIIVELL